MVVPKDNRPRVCALIPAYNESATIGAVVDGALPHVDTVVVIDDGSSDDTAEVARRHGATVICQGVNRGIGPTLQFGYEHVLCEGYDLVIQLDGDGQHDPKYIPLLMQSMHGCQLVIGSRFLNHSHRKYPLLRRLGITYYSWLTRLLAGNKVTDVTSGYRCYKSSLLRELTPLKKPHWALEQTLEVGRRGHRVIEVSVEMPIRNNGQSQFNLVSYARYPFRMLPVIFEVMRRPVK